MALEDMPEDEENQTDLNELAPDMPTDELVEEVLDEVFDDEAEAGEIAAAGEETEDDDLGEERTAVQIAKDDLGEEVTYGEKVQRRINRAVYERNTERDRANTAESKLEQYEREAAEREEAAEQNDETETEYQEILTQGDVEREDLVNELDEAFEEGDSKLAAELTGKISQHDTDVAQFKTAMENATEGEDLNEEHGEDSGEELSSLNASSDSWIQSNEWYLKPENDSLARLAEGIEDNLRAEGYDLGEELYTELDKRLLAAAPRLAIMKGGTDDESEETEASEQSQKPNKPKPVVSGQSSGDAAMPAKPKAGQITKSDLTQMAKYGFDPNSTVDRKNWLNRNAAL